MKRVHLYDRLAATYGAEHVLAIDTPREAVAALQANHPGFRRDFLEVGEFAVIVDGDCRTGDAAAVGPVSQEVHFVPIIEGRAFLGAALVTALIPAISGTAATIIGGLLVTGILFGVSLLFSPKQKKTFDPQEDTAKDASNYMFAGPENVTVQGVPVPLVYGRAIVGSVVVSAGLDLGVAVVVNNPGGVLFRDHGVDP